MKQLKFNNYSFLVLAYLFAGSLLFVGKPFPTEKYDSPIVKLTKTSAVLANGKEIDLNPSYGKFTMILVRHAEKVDNTKESGLNEEGIARANKLADILKGFKVDKVYTTNFNRAKLTAQPYKEKTGASMETYNSDQQSALLAKIKKQRIRNTLVVGHVNTVPALVNEIGKLKIKDFDNYEYDNLIVIKTDFRGKGKVHFFKY